MKRSAVREAVSRHPDANGQDKFRIEWDAAPGKRDIEARSLAMHRLVAGIVRGNPVRFEAVLPLLENWKGKVTPRTLPYLVEWERLARQGIEACLAMATEDSEHATTLRQSSPLSCILTVQERNAFLKAWKEKRETGRT